MIRIGMLFLFIKVFYASDNNSDSDSFTTCIFSTLFFTHFVHGTALGESVQMSIHF